MIEKQLKGEVFRCLEVFKSMPTQGTTSAESTNLLPNQIYKRYKS